MLLAMQIGVVGGTGPAGTGLSARLASLGHEVLVGSRDAARAQGVVWELRDRWADRVVGLRGVANEDAASEPDLVVLATVWEAVVDTAGALAPYLAGKVVVTMANGLERVGREFRAVLPPEGSLAVAVQAAAPDARVVAAFQHVPAAAFAELDSPLESDVVVCGDDAEARTAVLDLVASMPVLQAFDGGGLANALGIEAFAAVLLSVNLRHRGKGTLKLLGVKGHGAGAGV